MYQETKKQILAGLNRTIKAKIKAILYWIVNIFIGWIYVKRAAVLAYHSVSDNKVVFTVKPENFNRQMAYLKENNFNVISADVFLKYLKTGNFPAKTVLLTFDDGFCDTHLNVFPILKKYGFPAVIFLTTGFINKQIPNSMNMPLPALNWEQIEEMHNSGLIDFEPHTVFHPRLSQLGAAEAEKEIAESKRIIEEKLHKFCRIFAYPFGQYDSALQKIVQELGFEASFTVDRGWALPADNYFALRRFTVHFLTSFAQFKGQLSGSVILLKI